MNVLQGCDIPEREGEERVPNQFSGLISYVYIRLYIHRGNWPCVRKIKRNGYTKIDLHYVNSEYILHTVLNQRGNKNEDNNSTKYRPISY